MLKYFLFALGFCSGISLAEARPKTISSAHFQKRKFLEDMAATLNSFTTVREAATQISALQLHVTSLEKEFGPSALEQAFPKVSVIDDKLVLKFPDRSIKLDFDAKTPGDFLVNGKSWHLSPLATPSEGIHELQKILSPKTAWEDFLLPSAQAFEPVTTAIAVYAAGAVVAGGVCASTEVDWHGPIGMLFGVPYCTFSGLVWPVTAGMITLKKLDDIHNDMGMKSKLRKSVLFPVALKCPDENQGKLEVEWNSYGGRANQKFVVEDYSADRFPNLAQAMKADRDSHVSGKAKKVVSVTGVRVERWSNAYCKKNGVIALDATSSPVYSIEDDCGRTNDGTGENYSGRYQEVETQLRAYDGICAAPADQRARAKESFAHNASALKALFTSKGDFTDPAAAPGETSAQ